MIYLDSAATTLQKPPAVARAAAAAIRTLSSPGRGGYAPARRAAEVVLSCREEAAALFQVSQPERVVLTFNATHGLNLAVKSMVRPGSRILLSGYEHNAVTRPLAGIPGVRLQTVRAPMFRRDLFLEDLERRLSDPPDGMICTHVSNVFGCILPMDEIAALCARREVPLLVDASQSAGVLPIRMEAWRAAYIAMPGHKGLYGPQGTGLLLCRDVPAPLLEGGTGSLSLRQEMPEFLPDRLEAGTHNVPGAAGLLEGLRFVRRKGEEKIFLHESRLCEAAARRLADLPGAEVFRGEHGVSQSGVLSFRIRDRDAAEFAEILADRGIAVRGGWHCAPAAHRTAGTLETGTVRASFSVFNTLREIERFAEEVKRIL